MKARSIKTNKVRKFSIPEINLTDYIDLIDWIKCELSEPPITTHISDENLIEMLTNGNLPDVQHFPCHTQGVERCIKLVTEASDQVCGLASRDGFIRARLASRKKMPIFNTKRQFETETNESDR
jgi:hypothetical protein